MAIQPIDLQTMFMQMDKVGKNQAFQREGLAMQQSIQNVEAQLKSQQNVESVNDAPETAEGAKVDEDGSGAGDAAPGKKRPPANDTEEETVEEPKPINWDPRLGSRIDISG